MLDILLVNYGQDFGIKPEEKHRIDRNRSDERWDYDRDDAEMTIGASDLLDGGDLLIRNVYRPEILT